MFTLLTSLSIALHESLSDVRSKTSALSPTRVVPEFCQPSRDVSHQVQEPPSLSAIFGSTPVVAARSTRICVLPVRSNAIGSTPTQPPSVPVVNDSCPPVTVPGVQPWLPLSKSNIGIVSGGGGGTRSN